MRTGGERSGDGGSDDGPPARDTGSPRLDRGRAGLVADRRCPAGARRETKEPADLETAKLCYRAFELSMVLQHLGIRANLLEITPPLTITAGEVDRGMEILEQALVDVERGLVPDERAGKVGW